MIYHVTMLPLCTRYGRKAPAAGIIKASDFHGMDVKNAKGEQVGDIEDVVIDVDDFHEVKTSGERLAENLFTEGVRLDIFLYVDE